MYWRTSGLSSMIKASGRSCCPELEEALDQLRGVIRQIDLGGLRNLLHSGRQANGRPLRRIVHAEIITDLTDHDLTRVQAHTNGEAHSALQPKLVGIASQLIH